MNHFEKFSRDIAKHRDTVVSVLEFIDNIAAVKSTCEELEVKSVACSAFPNKIDEEWNGEINSNPDLCEWWNSGKPRRLKKVCNFQSVTENTPTTSETQPSQNTITNSENRQFHNTREVNTTQQRGQRARYGRVGNRQEQNRKPSETVNPRDRNPQMQNQSRPYRRTINSNQRRNTFNNSQRRGSDTNYYSDRYNNRIFDSDFQQSEIIYCTSCKRRGHTDDTCNLRKKCSYCNRQGHNLQDCRTKQQEERQENLFRNLILEQAHNNASLIQTVQRLIVPIQNPGNTHNSTGFHMFPGQYHNPHINNNTQIQMPSNHGL